MSWKPIMPFKLKQVCSTNVTPTDMRIVSEHTRSYEQAQDQDGVVILLDLNRSRCASRFPSNLPLQLPPYNNGGYSGARYAKVLRVLVAILPVGSIQGNGSSITQYPIKGYLDVSQNNPVAKSIHQIMPTIFPNGAVGIMENTFMESMIDNQPIIDNHDTNLKNKTQMATLENGNQIEVKRELSNLSPNLQRKQLEEKPLTVPCVAKRKHQKTKKEESLITSEPTIDLTTV